MSAIKLMLLIVSFLRLFINNDSSDPLEYCVLNDNTTKDNNLEVTMCVQFLEASLQASSSCVKMEALVIDNKPLSNEDHTPKVELKPLPSSVRYEYLGLNSTYPMIVSASQIASQIESLLRELRLHRKAVGVLLMILKEFTLLCGCILF